MSRLRLELRGESGGSRGEREEGGGEVGRCVSGGGCGRQGSR